MNSFEYEFYNEIRSKKGLAASARHKKNGSKSKKCTLPSDNLTNKQIRERHGDTIVYNLTKPMQWREFKKLPKHAQEEYLRFLTNNFGATATDIAKMFGVVARTVSKYAELKELDIQFQRGQRMGKQNREKWSRFLLNETIQNPVAVNLPYTEDTEDSADENTDTQDKQSTECGVVPQSYSMSEITLRFDGVIDVNGVANTLKAVLGESVDGCVFISYQANQTGKED